MRTAEEHRSHGGKLPVGQPRPYHAVRAARGDPQTRLFVRGPQAPNTVSRGPHWVAARWLFPPRLLCKPYKRLSRTRVLLPVQSTVTAEGCSLPGARRTGRKCRVSREGTRGLPIHAPRAPEPRVRPVHPARLARAPRGLRGRKAGALGDGTTRAPSLAGAPGRCWEPRGGAGLRRVSRLRKGAAARSVSVGLGFPSRLMGFPPPETKNRTGGSQAAPRSTQSRGAQPEGGQAEPPSAAATSQSPRLSCALSAGTAA